MPACVGAPSVALQSLRTTHAVLSTLQAEPSLCAFLLPGIVSKCSALIVARPGVVRLNASTQAAALDCMALAVISALEGLQLRSEPAHTAASCPTHGGLRTAVDALEELRSAAQRSQPRPGAGEQQVEATSKDGKQSSSSFRAVRDQEWLRGTCGSLHTFWSKVALTACSHTSPRARAAAARAMYDMLSRVPAALSEELRMLLLRFVLYLACDAAPSASKPCTKLLKAVRESSASSEGKASYAVLAADLVAMLPQLQADFCGAIIRPASEAVAAAKRFAACLRGVPTEQVVSVVVLPAAARQSLLASATRYFEVDGSLAALWLGGHSSHAQLNARVAAASAGSVAALKDRSALDTDSNAAPGASALPAADSHPQSAASPFVAGSMPLGLKYVSTEEVFAAASEVPQALGCVCASLSAAEGGAAALAVLDELRRSLEETAGPRQRALADVTRALLLLSACYVLFIYNVMWWQVQGVSCCQCQCVLSGAQIGMQLLIPLWRGRQKS